MKLLMPHRSPAIPPLPQPAAMTAAQFRAILEAAGLNQTRAAEALGVSITTVNRWFKGLVTISEARAKLIRERIKGGQK